MDPKERGKLVDALLKCPSVGNRSQRDILVAELRDDIKNKVQLGHGERVDVANLVKTCLNYPNGIEELMAKVRIFEGRSLAMKDVDYLLLDIYDFDIRTSARPMHAQLLEILATIELSSEELQPAYRASLPAGVEEPAEPQGLFDMTCNLWNLSLRPEGQRRSQPQPIETFVDRLGGLDPGAAGPLRDWARKIQPDLYRDAEQRQPSGGTMLSAETQTQTEGERRLTILSSVLSYHYPTLEASGEIVAAARLNPVRIDFRKMSSANWDNILKEAQTQGKVRAVVEAALAQHRDDEWLRLALKEQEDAELEEVRKQAEPEAGPKASRRGPRALEPLERVIGDQEDILLPAFFFELGLQRARPVARVVLADGMLGSGFLTDDNLLITNHHVLPSVAEAEGAVVQFNYEWGIDGLYRELEEFRLAPEETFATSPVEEDDWTAVRVRGDASASYGTISLERADPQVRDRVFVIQHPMGMPKQIALFNTIVFTGKGRVQYLGSTRPGSGGAPVFDTDWRVVAVHHAGGWLHEPGTEKRVYRKEAIHINTIIDGLAAAGLHPG